MLEALWGGLSDPATQKTLTWLGGGAIVVAGGAWTVFKYFWKPSGDKAKGQTGTTPSTTETLIDGNGNIVGHNVAVDHSTTNTRIHRTGLTGLEVSLVGLLLVGAVLLGGALAGSRISANNSSLAAGGDISGNTLHIQGKGDRQ